MPLMGSFYVGVSGLQTSQNALNTTAHNLSNIETEGYTRQQTLLEDRFYNTIGNASVSAKQTGLGVEYAEIRQVRDAFLDKSYREETGRKEFYEIAYETSTEIETMLGEMEGASFHEALSDYWTSVQELQKDPSSAVVQGSFVATALQFLERAQAVYDGLNSFQDNLNARVTDQVKQINEYGQQIKKLNDAIKRTEIGQEEANDLRDARNLILDKLSEMCNISYQENVDRVVEVQVEGTPFVCRDRVFEMDVKMDEATGFYTPIWPWNDDAEVFDIDRLVNSADDTDVGELKSILLMRGDRRANYTDLMTDREIGGNHYDVYNQGYTDADGKEKVATKQSVVLTMQAELDNLVHALSTTVNDILCNEQGKDPAERYYANKEDLPIELFERLGESSRYEEYTGAADADHPYGAGWYYIPEDISEAPVNVSSMYTLSNLKINPDLLKEPTKLSFLTKDKQVDQNKADALAKSFKDPFGTLNPDTNKEYNFTDYYDAMVVQIGNTGFIYKTIADSQNSTVVSLENARQSVMGTSSNEELSNMIKFQNAYNAASRYINAVDAMLDHLINRLS
ncbi:MAG: flagellar hook-associated protein FlgK [Lachnospiraceae bacterium]|nr:flagellar hook-associated protein FlgK [Lachnospiraceae bacterium]